MPPRPEVDAWFARYENPMKRVVLRVRELILAADPRIDECIKWQAPTFTYLGNLASFFPRATQHASLMFHHGAKIPGAHPLLASPGEIARVVKLANLAEVEAAREELIEIVRAWCDWRERATAAKAAAKAAAAQPPAATKPAATAKPASKKPATKPPAAKRPTPKPPAAKRPAARRPTK